MTRYRTAVLLAVILLATFSEAQRVKNADRGPTKKPSDDPHLAATIVIGVIATTTLAVLVLLIPTIIYYKFTKSQEDEIITTKK